MQIKRYEAANMAEAVERVKADLGPEALVLSVRRLRRDGGLFGLLGRPVVEVTAGIDRVVRRGEPAREAVDVPVAAPDSSWRELRLTRALVDPLESEVRRLRREVERMATGMARDDVERREQARLMRVLRDLRSRLEPGADPHPLSRRLREAGLAPRHIEHLLDDLGERPEEGPEPDLTSLCHALAHRLEARLAVPRPDDPARVSIFVGAPGVGKTTTLAKLAAREAQEAGRAALVTTDSFRIGAEDQLRTYADLLQVPFASAVSADDVAEQVRRAEGRHVFVDTAGRGRGHEDAICELRRIRDVLGDAARIHHVVSATTQEADLRAELDRFAPLRPDSLIVAKVDETDHLGGLANVALDEETPPLTWFGTGQRVPEDLALPEPVPLAGRLLGAPA